MLDLPRDYLALIEPFLCRKNLTGHEIELKLQKLLSDCGLEHLEVSPPYEKGSIYSIGTIWSFPALNLNRPEIKYFCGTRAVRTVPGQCIMRYDES